MKSFRHFIFLLTVPFFVFGCGSETGDSIDLKVFHALTNATSIDFVIDGDNLIDDLGYGLQSEEIGFDEGTRQVEVEVAGLLASVIDENVSFSLNQKYRVYVIGTLADPSILVHRDSLEDGPENKEDFRLRIVDLSVQNELYDVYIINAGSSIARATPVFENVNFREITRFRDILQGVVQVVVTRAGTREIVLDSGPLRIEEDKDYSYILFDQPQGGSPILGSLVKEN